MNSQKNQGRPKSVLLLGSGGLRIGQAGEFDYSGSQAVKALKEEGIKVILINPNVATYQTSEGMADKTYFLPVNPYFVEKVIEKEKPEGILLSFGGQTALNCGIALHKSKALEKHNVRVLGTPVSAVVKTEDKGLFAKELKGIGVKVPKSISVKNLKDAGKALDVVGLPAMIRSGYSLGGLGSGVARTREEFQKVVGLALAQAPQVLVEEFLGGWKEIEYEVVRDSFNNCITVCNMENFDPMGIHTGESIVVAPSQTLSNHEYHFLRDVSIKVIRHFGIVGECNIQFALNPENSDYRVIEVNARLSRSSALASKATGYPLAFVATKLALGYSMNEVRNTVTKVTSMCFEPALDYIVVKVPRWDLQKFKKASSLLGPEMKSVGEVMAIGRKFEEALQKALRMLGNRKHGLAANNEPKWGTEEQLEKELANPTDQRVYAVAEAFRKGWGVERVNKLTNIDAWFLEKIKNITVMEKDLSRHSGIEDLSREQFLEAKRLGFSDFQIAKIVLKARESKMNEVVQRVRARRKELNVLPVVKQIDTLAGEFPAQTNYLYFTYNGDSDDLPAEKESENKVIVLGSGSYSIGSSVEFDWCCVSAAAELRRQGYETIMVNCNPETVSTDYDMCSKLYFEELTFERVSDIYDREKPLGLVVSMGGQVPNNLAKRLGEAGMKVLGTSTDCIDRAENRHKFSALLDELGIDQPEWKELTSIEESKAFAEKAGYPVLVRPSYVLSGAAMNVAFNPKELEEYLGQAQNVSKEYPVVISKFITGAKEIEVDAVARNGGLLAWALSEHVENAGVHSGDATMVFPANKVYTETAKQAQNVAESISRALNITGPFNIQFLAKDNKLKVIECNLRASRSFPFVSKVLKENFIHTAVKAIMGKETAPVKKNQFALSYVGVKCPVFSYTRIKGADPIPGVEMASTGEVACIGANVYDAYLKSLVSTEVTLPSKGVLVSIGGDENRYALAEQLSKLESLGLKIYATHNTQKFLTSLGVKSKKLNRIGIEKKPNVSEYLERKKIDLVISIPRQVGQEDAGDAYALRRHSVDRAIALINNVQVAKMFLEAFYRLKEKDLEVKSWDEYS